MRSVGQVLLAVVLVVGALSGGIQVIGATESPSADARSLWSASASDAPLLARPTPGTHGPAVPADVGSLRSSDVEPRSAVEVTPALTETDDATASPASVTESASSTGARLQTAADVSLTQEFRLTPDQPGEVAVTHNFTLDERIANLRTTVPRRVTVTDTVGFSADNETIYRWDGQTERPSISYTLPVNETGSRSYASANGSLLFADVGEWALLRRPVQTTRWQAFGSEPVTFDRQTVTAGPGAAGDSLVYLGEVDLYPRTTDNQTFRLAVPAAANMTESRDDVLDAMERASNDLAVGERDSSVFAVAAPTEGVPWAVRGLSIGDSDFWVGADERLATTDNIWIHEYVHTRQDYDPTTTTRWTKEGFASYYAARQALQYQSVTFEEFAAAMNASTYPSTSATLADPESWDNLTAYRRGALVAGQFDRRIRRASGDGATVDAVVASMNADTDTVNASEFFDAVGAAGNESVRESMRPAVYTNQSVVMWNRSQHVAAFGPLPGRVVYGLPRGVDPGDYRVRGPYRNASLAGNEDFTLVTGESIVVQGRVSNVGNATGYYDVSLRVNDTVVDSADGEVSGGSVSEVPLSHTFATPGVYEIGVGNDTATVTVERPADASIVGFQVTPGSLEQYGSATVSVTVRNDASIPARREIRIDRNDETVFTRSVRLAPKASRTTDVEVTFPNAGAADVLVEGVGSIQVAVESVGRPATATPERTTTEPPTPTPGEPSRGTGFGFEWLVALVALVATIYYVGYRR